MQTECMRDPSIARRESVIYLIFYSHNLNCIYDSSKLELAQSNKVSSTVSPDLLTLFPAVLGHELLAVTN